MTNNEGQNEQRLQNVVTRDPYWLAATEGMLSDGREVCEQAERYGYWLAGAVVLDSIGFSVKDLRKFVQWTNNLDREAVEASAANGTFGDADHLESLARRIAHHSAKAALALVQSDSHRIGYRANLRVRHHDVFCGLNALARDAQR